MYCERCGKTIDESLNYCNNCGAQLRRESPPPRSLVAVMIGATALTTIAGLLIMAVLLAILLERSQFPEPVFAFGAVFLLVLGAISFMMMRQVSKLIDAELKSRDFSQRTSPPPAVQLPPRSTSQLEEFREPASVTDHTTRTLEPTRVQER
jgi:hypothetical protein